MRGVLEAVAALVERQRAALTAEFGWTQCDLTAHAEPGVLRLSGQVLLPRITAGLCACVTPLLPVGWQLDAGAVAVRPGLGWRSLGPGVTPLWRAPRLNLATGMKGHVPSDLTSELLASDGAVELLVERGGWALVRADDGTVGWLQGPLRAGTRPLRRALRVTPEVALRRLTSRLRGHLGVPYRLGGTTRRHIDCSGLVQRCVREALGLVLPRHSTDQLSCSAATSRSLGEPGDLLFMAGLDAAVCHVGVVLRGPRPGTRTLLHASSRRGRVVEEPLDRCLARASRVQHMEFAQLLELR
jgi:hypothetical protein